MKTNHSRVSRPLLGLEEDRFMIVAGWTALVRPRELDDGKKNIKSAPGSAKESFLTTKCSPKLGALCWGGLEGGEGGFLPLPRPPLRLAVYPMMENRAPYVSRGSI